MHSVLKDMLKGLTKTGRSAVRLAHLLWEQGVVSSNLVAPTKRSYFGGFSFCLYTNYQLFLIEGFFWVSGFTRVVEAMAIKNKVLPTYT